MKMSACAAAVLVAFSMPSARVWAEDFPTINEQAEVRRFANDDSSYNFTRKIDGNSIVVVRAPKGTVKFSTAPAGLDEGSKVDGKSRVLIEAERVAFNAKISGESVVLVIVSKDGTIAVNDKINGKAQLIWCKADDNDPTPTIKTRLDNPESGSKYNQVNRAQMEKLINEHDLK